MNEKTKYLKIFLNILVSVTLIFAVCFFLPKLMVFFMPFVIAFIISLIANPIVKFLDRHLKIKRKYGSVIIIVAVIGLIVLLCFGIISLIISGLKSFASQLPSIIESAEAELTAALDDLQKLLNNMPFIHNVDFSKLSDKISSYLGNLLVDGNGKKGLIAIKDTAMKIPNIIVNIIICLLAAYFFTADREKLMDFLRKHSPENIKKQADNIYRQTILVVVGYFKAQLKIMLVIYVEVFIGLLILGIKYSWLISLGIAFLDMLPVFGTGTVLIPWAVIKLLTGNYAVAAGMVITYAIAFVLHQAIQPKLIGDSVGMNPFLALLFMYIGYRISSVLGMIIAIPLGMILINLTKTGVFDNLILNIKILVHDFNEFRRI